MTLQIILMPKKLKYSRKIQTELDTFVGHIKLYCNKINKEYVKKMNIFIDEIAAGENLDPTQLKEKYLNKKTVQEPEELEELDEPEKTNTIFDKIEFEGQYYFVEPIENGAVYDTNSVMVGQMVNNKIIFLPTM